MICLFLCFLLVWLLGAYAGFPWEEEVKELPLFLWEVRNSKEFPKLLRVPEFLPAEKKEGIPRKSGSGAKKRPLCLCSSTSSEGIPRKFLRNTEREDNF